MRIHELKTWPEYFHKSHSGRKKFEVRYNDKDYKLGDFLLLQEYSPINKKYTGEEYLYKVTYILRDNNFVKEGYVIMSIKKILYNFNEELFINGQR